MNMVELMAAVPAPAPAPTVSSGAAPWWLPVATAVLAGGFALLGVRLNQRHAAAQRRLDRLDERRVEQREALVEVLATGREYATSLEAVLMIAGLIADTVEFGNTSTVEGHGPMRKAHSRALLTARLLVRDPQTLEQVTKMSVYVEDVAPTLIGPLWDSVKSHGRAEAEVMGRSLGSAAAYGHALDELERLTRERMVEDIPTEQRRWRHRLRLARKRKPAGAEAGDTL